MGGQTDDWRLKRDVVASALVLDVTSSFMSLDPAVAQLKKQNSSVIDELLALIALRKQGRLTDLELNLRRKHLLADAAPRAPVDPGAAPYVHATVAASALDEGAEHEDLNDLNAACEQYEAALAIAHPKVSPEAALMLGHARWKMGSPDLAREARTTAMAFGASNASCESAHMLGDLLRAQDDAHKAATAYEFVISSRHPTAYLAAKQLADLHKTCSRSHDKKFWGITALS